MTLFSTSTPTSATTSPPVAAAVVSVAAAVVSVVPAAVVSVAAAVVSSPGRRRVGVVVVVASAGCDYEGESHEGHRHA